MIRLHMLTDDSVRLNANFWLDAVRFWSRQRRNIFLKPINRRNLKHARRTWERYTAELTRRKALNCPAG